MHLIAFFGVMMFVFLLEGAVNVLWLGEFDHAYGAEGTFAVILLFGFVAALLTTCAYAISATIFRRQSSTARSVVHGLCCALVASFATTFLASLSKSGTIPIPVTAFAFLTTAFVAALVSPRQTPPFKSHSE